MDLNEAQISAVKSAVKEGQSLAEIQRLLREQFDLSMTYMDVRLLVDDLDILFDEPEEASTADEEEPSTVEPEIVDEGTAGGVSVDVDPLTRPGALVSGNVIFSDGVKLGWQLSSAGQLGLIPGDDPEYRPSPEDVQAFQTQLEEVLRSKGF
ncbi:MAG: hypothetical protein AAF546_01800 [Verrucomicrobiota bacterium]